MARGFRSSSVLPAIAGMVATTAVVASACSDQGFAACEQNRSCEEPGGGEAGEETSGSGGAGTGGSGRGGRGGSSSGGTSSTAGGSGGDAGAPGTGGDAGDGSPGGEGGLGGDDGTGGSTAGEAGAAPEPDTTPPLILDVAPGDGQSGVRSNAVLRVTFSEPMNRAATEAALTSELVSSGGSFTWNSEGSELSFRPTAGFPYATGTTPGITARTLAATVTTAATDLAGNALAGPYQWSFTTLRRITHTITPGANGVWEVYVVPQAASPCDGSTHVGDIAPGIPNGHATLVEVPIGELPEDIVEFEAATFRARQQGSCGSPFPALGSVHLYQIDAHPITSAAFTTPAPLRDLGVLSNSTAAGQRSLGVLDALRDTYDNRGARQNRLQFRIRFDAAAANANGLCDGVDYTCDGYSLVTEYLLR